MNLTRKKSLSLLLMILCVVLAGVIAATVPARAADSTTSAIPADKKYATIAMGKCVSAGILNSSVEVKDSLASATRSVDDIVKDSSVDGKIRALVGKAENTVSCLDLLKSSYFLGRDSYPGNSAGADEMRADLKKLGYEVEESGLDIYDKCLAYRFDKMGENGGLTGEYIWSNRICHKKNDEVSSFVVENGDGYGTAGDAFNLNAIPAKSDLKNVYRFVVSLELDDEEDHYMWDGKFKYVGSNLTEILPGKGSVIVESKAFGSRMVSQHVGCSIDNNEVYKDLFIVRDDLYEDYLRPAKEAIEEDDSWPFDESGWNNYNCVNNDGFDTDVRRDPDDLSADFFDIIVKTSSVDIDVVDSAIKNNLRNVDGLSQVYDLEDNGTKWALNKESGVTYPSEDMGKKFKLTTNAFATIKRSFSTSDKLSNEDGFSIYQSYVNTAFSGKLLNKDVYDSLDDKSAYSGVQLVDGGELKQFYYPNNDSSILSEKYNAIFVDPSGGHDTARAAHLAMSGSDTGTASLKEIIDLLNKGCDSKAKKKKSGCIEIDVSKVVADLNPASSSPEPVVPEEDDESVKPTCANSAGALGWIICPIMTTIADAAESAYDFFIMPSLKVSPELLSGDDNGTHGAWKTFRDFSNIVLIAFLLFIIFSQVTGFGIDNYGIKKSLPKLIVAAIMTNASYLICQLTVDLSNILGAGLYEIFGTLSDNVSVGSVNVANASTFTVSGTLASIGLLVAMVAGIGSLIAAISANGIAIIIPIFLAVISVGISIATLFVILAVRKAGVLVLVVISPLAFILYSLPNTKRLFSKWFSSLKALLLVYPITGALVGGGNFVSRLLLSGSGNVDFWMALTAMIVGIVPIFFIPTLLKQSLSMLGNIGAKVSGVGRTVGSRTKRSADNSKLANHIRGVGKFQGQKNEYRKAQRTLGKYGDRDPRSLSASKLSKIAAAQGTVDAHDKSMKGLYSTQYKNMGTDQLKDSIDKMRIDALSGGVDTLPMVAALSELSGRDPDAFWEQYTKVSDSKGFQDTMKNDASSRERVAELLSSQTGNPFAKTAAKQLRKLDGADPSKTAELTSVRTMMQGSGFREKFQGLGVAAMRDMDKDVLGSASKDSNMARMFSSEQIQAGMTADYDDSTRSSFNDMMKTRALSMDSSTGASMLSSDLSSMTAEQLLRADSSTLDMIANDQYETTDVNGNTVMQSVSAYDGFSSRTMAEAMAKGGSGKNAGALGEILAKRSNINDLDALSASQLASVSPEHIKKIREGMIEKAKAQGRSDADAASDVDAKIKDSLGSKWNEIKANNNLKGRVHPNLEAALGAQYW